MGSVQDHPDIQQGHSQSLEVQLDKSLRFVSIYDHFLHIPKKLRRCNRNYKLLAIKVIARLQRRLTARACLGLRSNTLFDHRVDVLTRHSKSSIL